MKKKLTMFLTLFFMGIGFLTAQTQVRGTVVDDNGDPAIGATIQIKGTTQGTVTDIDGNFNLSAPADGILVISYVGYVTQEVPVSASMRVELVMDSQMLDEVIAVAYGTARRSSFTGAASQVSGDRIQRLQVSNISKSLEGAMSGVQVVSSNGTPGSSADIIIRGLGSISANQNPLIVVDGVPYEGSLNSISAQDIESLTVLKDAAANSMYGARGSNGVLIITTKSGRAGQVKVNFESRLGFNARGVKSYDIITDPGEYYEMMFESVRNSLLDEMSLMDANSYTANNLISQYLRYNTYKGIADNQLIDPLTGKLNPAASIRKWNDNWAKDPFENGLRQEYNMNISGGSENTSAFFSLSYLGDEGMVVNSSFDRIATRLKVDQKIGDFVKVGGNIAYANTTQNTFGSTGSNYSNIFMLSQLIGPIYPIYLYDTEGNPQYDITGNRLYDWGTEYQRPYNPQGNPYAMAKEGVRKYITDNISSRGYIEVPFLNDFKFTANIAYDVFLRTETEYTTPIGGDAKDVGGRGYKRASRNAALNMNQLLAWERDFNDHSLNVLLGHETKNDRYNYLMGHMTNFVNSHNPDFANATQYQDLDAYTTEYSLEGYFSRAEYNYLQKYYASASFRRDASSIFHPDVRWGSFWSLGGAWRVSEEPFLLDHDVVSNLRLKASYGTQGNDHIYMNTNTNERMIKAYLDLYRIDRVGGEPGMTKVHRGNSDLTWEKSKNFNIGFELGLWHRINVNADFFVKRTHDLLYQSPLAPSEGNPSTIWRNEMDMKNVGIETEIFADIINTRDLKWNASLNLTHYKNSLTRLPVSKPEEEFPGGYQQGSYWRKLGGTLYDWYTYEWAGVDEETGLPQYNKYEDDGTITLVNSTSEATLRQTGKSAIPKLTGGFATTLEARGFDFTVQTAFQLGGYVWDSFYQSLMNTGGNGDNMHKDMFHRWTPTNAVTDTPMLLYQDREGNGTSDRWLTSASYFSLRNVTLGYTLPDSFTYNIKVDRVRVYVTGDNIWLHSARKGLDPRQQFSGTTGYVYSALSTYSFGINLTF